MQNTDILKNRLVSLCDETNSNSTCSTIKFNQQSIVKENMSFTSCNGRIYIQPHQHEYDVSLSGAALEEELRGEFKDLFNKSPDGYKQSNSNTGTYRQAYWRTAEFSLVKTAVERYAKTRM